MLCCTSDPPYPDFPPESPDPLPLPPDTETVTQAPSPETEPSTGVTQRDAINNKLAMIQNFVVKWDINDKSLCENVDFLKRYLWPVWPISWSLPRCGEEMGRR